MLGLGLLLPSRGALAALLGGLIALGIVALVAEERGATRERAACLARAIAEQNRQALANETAREATRAIALGSLEAERQTAAILDEVLHAPVPASPRCGLGADRVRALDRLR
ncbi:MULTISPECIES: hypothetical protein [Prosthecodimorpha]|uniref:Uncharacterized protein n=2 Tax=Prosthecodimorpha TaxID=2981530 RepID=A0A0P6W778_9HYPH|nr:MULTISPECIES: hypothetical protein [Hyphomicrobiales]KPL53216.1 hypothetical protein ABB55_14155 [Prosthecomicrobium hirschii]MBT9291868.1 hypothetical protein [Prosthecodimorpha staleyi]